MKKRFLKPYEDTLLKIIFALVCAFIVILFTQDGMITIGPLKELELNFIDNRFQQRGEIPIDDTADVVIVEITQDTYDQLPEGYKSWPWRRSVFAKLIENLNEAGAKAIGIDIVMSNKDRYAGANDSLLLNTIRESGNVVVAGKLNIADEDKLQGILSKKENGIVVTDEKEDYNNIFYHADSSIGLVQVPADYDGVYRRYAPYVYSLAMEEKIPSFGFALLNKYYGLPANNTAESNDDHFNIAGKNIPKFDEHSMLINFYGKSRAFPHYKVIDIIDDDEFDTIDEIELDTELNTWDNPDYGMLYSGLFKDKVVIIGSTMPEDKDLLPVSISGPEGGNMMYGVEFHANVVQNVLNENYLKGQSVLSEVIAIILLSLIGFGVPSFLRSIKRMHQLTTEVLNVLLVVLLLFLVYKLSVLLFNNFGYVMVIVSPALAVIVGYFGSTAYHFVKERRRNAVIRGMFNQYVNESVVNELLTNPDKLRLGGERKELSIMFTDIAGFTTFSEKKKPEELVSFINEFLSEMSEVVIDTKGTLDKYLGDSIMAFWGAPISMDNHAYLACKCAVVMQKRLKQLNEKWKARHNFEINIRTGINTGEVIVGNIGGEKRFDYTVIGDDVNLASRLEGANKNYGTAVMISDKTLALVEDDFIVRELDTIKVKGKNKPTKVYELLGNAKEENAKKTLSRYEKYLEGLEYYKQKNFEEALICFTEAEKVNPKDKPTVMYQQRCKNYITSPPPEDWNGVFTMKTK